MNTNLIIGKINSGKTSYLFKEVRKSINNNENLLIIDNKQEYFKTFKKELDDNGYNTLVLNLNDASRSNSYNPLLLPFNYYKEGKKDKALDLINELGLELFKEDNNCDPFWQISATDYFTALVLILFKESKDITEINLGSIQAMINLGEHKIGDTSIIKKYFDSLDVMDNIYVIGSTIVYAPPETRGSIIAVAKQKLNVYCMREQLLNNLGDNDINTIDKKTAIFIIGKDNLNRIGNILINQLVYSNQEFTYILDNLNDMPVLLELNNMLNNKLKLFVTTRNIEQLENKYGKYIQDKFENIIDEFDNNKLELGNCNDYPESKNNELNYFNIEKFVENK